MYNAEKLYIEETSGSTGTPLRIFCNKDAYKFNHALTFTRLMRWANIDLNDRKIMFGGKPVIPISAKTPHFG